MKRLALSLSLLVPLIVTGCNLFEAQFVDGVILPEQKSIAIRHPDQLPPAPIPQVPPPRTVTEPAEKTTTEWRISLDEAIKLALVNARVVRVLTGVSAVSSGRTIYDVAISNTAIDQQQARFDPTVNVREQVIHTDNPAASFDLFGPVAAFLGSTGNQIRSDVGVTKTNVLGGQWSLNWVENPSYLLADNPAFRTPLYPQNQSLVEVGYTQPLLQGAGFAFNTAPIVLARIDTERSYFQYKDSVQELVRGVIEAYWNLVNARTAVWAAQIQVNQSTEAFERAEARFKVRIDALGPYAQAKVTLNQFQANLIAAKADVLAFEAALRNILGLPPSDGKELVPTSVPAKDRLRPIWEAVLQLAERRRPDLIELKLVLEADQVRLMQSENQMLPRLDLSGTYRWNGLAGEQINGERVSTNPGQFTDWTVGLNFSVPLGLREGRARVRQQALVIARDRANLEQGLHQMAHDLAISMRNLDSAYDQYEAFKETRAAALENLKAQIAEYNTDRFIFLNVLQALTAWGDSVRSEARALLSYNTTLATIERQTGTILETHGLVFNEERLRFAGPLGCCADGVCYPSALPPAGEPTRYPATGQPGENAFDLKTPELRTPDPKGRPDPKELPKPRVDPAGKP